MATRCGENSVDIRRVLPPSTPAGRVFLSWHFGLAFVGFSLWLLVCTRRVVFSGFFWGYWWHILGPSGPQTHTGRTHATRSIRNR